MVDLQPNLELTTAQAEHLLGSWLGERPTCSAVVPLKGGLVNSVFRLEFDRPPSRAVVKIHGIDGNTFAAEARSLRYLAAETSCPVPRVHAHDSSGRVIPYAFLLLEHLEGECLQGGDVGPVEREQIDIELAGLLSELHRRRGDHWGLLGAEHRASPWNEVFAGRLAETRASPGLEARLAPDVLGLVDDAIELARTALVDGGVPTLIHGDLWDGNLLVQREGEHWRISGLLDPKLQFADSELELAYLEVFDNPRRALFEAYTQQHPLRPGYERRRLFYWLETALEHVALFDDEFFREFTARTAAATVHG